MKQIKSCNTQHSGTMLGHKGVTAGRDKRLNRRCYGCGATDHISTDRPECYREMKRKAKEYRKMKKDMERKRKLEDTADTDSEKDDKCEEETDHEKENKKRRKGSLFQNLAQ